MFDGRSPAAHRTKLILLFACGLASAATTSAQMHGTGFAVPDSYPPPHQDRLRTLVTGDEATSQTDGTFLVKNFKLRTFSETGPTNAELVAEAPSCTFDRVHNTASSPGSLQITSG